MCHTIGLPPTGSMGFGSISPASRIRVPCPPHRIAVFTVPYPPSARPKANDSGNIARLLDGKAGASLTAGPGGGEDAAGA